MSGTQTVAKSVYVPAPISGLNLVCSPFDFKPTEARSLANYWVYDWGIRQRPAWEAIATMNVNIIDLRTYVNSNGADRFLWVQDNGGSAATLQLAQAPSGAAVSAYTGPALPTSSGITIYDSHQFGAYVYYSGTPAGIRITANTGAGTYVAFTFTGPTELTDMWDYKKRFYGIEKGTSTVWYGGLSSISGAMTSVDFSTIVPGSTPLLFGTSWSYNQGLSNDDLLVLVSVAGDVLVYSGDDPNASNFNLLWRGKIPKPVTDSSNIKKCFIPLGQDILIGTERGIVSLKTFIQGSQLQGEDYYLVSRNLGDITLYPVNPAQDQYQPFVYFYGEYTGFPGPGGGSASPCIFVLNYERGAWSVFTGNGTPSSSTAGSMVAVGDRLICADRSGSATYSLAPTGSIEASSSVYSWATPFYSYSGLASGALNAVPNESLHLKTNFLRIISRWVAGGTFGLPSIFNSMQCALDLNDTAQNGDSLLTSIGATQFTPIEQQLQPPGLSKYISYIQSADGTQTTTQIDIIGFSLFYEQGGAF